MDTQSSSRGEHASEAGEIVNSPSRKRKRRCTRSNSTLDKTKSSSNTAVDPLNTDVADTPGSSSSPNGDTQPTCTICLEEVTNMAYTDTCLVHKFCFMCIVEWSKVKAVCPLCKISFTSIIHTIKSDKNYKSYEIPPEPQNSAFLNANNNDSVLLANFPELGENSSDSTSVRGGGRVFQSFTDFFTLAQRIRSVINRNSRLIDDLANVDDEDDIDDIYGGILPSFADPPPRPRGQGRRGRGRRHHSSASTDVRHTVYSRNRWVDPSSVADVTGRYRESGPMWYRNQQATLHRLVPWLNRELEVLLGSNQYQVPHVVQLVMDLICDVEISSNTFFRRLMPYLGSNARHFQHEFLSFARSVYDMVGFDRHAVYVPQEELNGIRSVQPEGAGNDSTISNDGNVVDESVMVVRDDHNNTESATVNVRRRRRRLMEQSPPPPPAQQFQPPWRAMLAEEEEEIDEQSTFTQTGSSQQLHQTIVVSDDAEEIADEEVEFVANCSPSSTSNRRIRKRHPRLCKNNQKPRQDSNDQRESNKSRGGRRYSNAAELIVLDDDSSDEETETPHIETLETVEDQPGPSGCCGRTSQSSTSSRVGGRPRVIYSDSDDISDDDDVASSKKKRHEEASIKNLKESISVQRKKSGSKKNVANSKGKFKSTGVKK